MQHTDSQTQTDQQEFIAREEIREAQQHEITVFRPAADWNNNMLAAFQAALKKPGEDLERVRELLKIQKEIQQENARLEFNAAMARVQARMVPVVKNKHNKQTDSWYADLHAICLMVTPIYSAEGFSVSYSTSSVGDKGQPLAEGYTRTIQTLAHVAGYEKQNFLDLPIDVAGKDGRTNKTQIHGIKSSHSYARNTLLTMAFNIAQQGVDDDGNAAGAHERGPEVEVLSEEQLETVLARLLEKNLSPKWLASQMRVESVDQIPAARFDIAIANIQKAKAQATPPKA
jgi:hypothetical protein